MSRLCAAPAPPYAVVRPGRLTDARWGGVRLEQGDTGDGQVSRDTVADAVAHPLPREEQVPVTFEVFDGDRERPVRWPRLLSAPASVSHS